jgi:plasmid stabilization system protein ParE
MRVRYTPRAGDDLRTILSYIGSQSPQGAINVARTMRRAIG